VKASARRLSLLLALLAPLASFCQTEAQPPQSAEAARSRPNSVLVFGGRLSTTDFTSTLLYNETYTPSRPEIGEQAWDNHIAGVDYERDVLGLARDLRLRAEAGIDDRYGHYLVCCLIPLPGDPRTYPARTVRTNGLVHSVELWLGGKVRWENFKLGGVGFEVAGTVGLSGVTRPIGRERQRQISDHGNAHLLGFVAPELGVSLDAVPHFELVARVMHRSGAGGTFGGIREGYNADVLGIRYAF
jgi:hypothetical protein